MLIKRILFICIAFIVSMAVQAQSAKKIKAHKITSKTIVEIEVERGTNARTIEEFEAFDEEGNIIEYKDFDSEGKLKLWVKYEYNADEEVIKEVYLSDKEKMLETIEYVFKDGIKREKLYYDSKNRLVKKKVYEYTFK